MYAIVSARYGDFDDFANVDVDGKTAHLRRRTNAESANFIGFHDMLFLFSSQRTRKRAYVQPSFFCLPQHAAQSQQTIPSGVLELRSTFFLA
jgi:hypothetical protein